MSIIFERYGDSITVDRGGATINEFYPFHSLDKPSGRKELSEYILFLEFLNERRALIEFRLSQISNQPTWTNTELGLETAIQDIIDWMNEASNLSFSGLTNTELRLNPIHVIVDNQISLTTVSGYLQDIKDYLALIEPETQPLEDKLTSVQNAIDTSSEINHSDLLDVKSFIDGLEIKDDTIISKLNDVISNTTSNATASKQDVGNASLSSIDNKLSNPIHVIVDTISFSSLESLLTDIKAQSVAINLNTDALETKVDQVKAEITSVGTVNSSNLVNIFNQVVAINGNTDGLEGFTDEIESKLASILAKLIVSPASEFTLSALNSKIPILTLSGDSLKVFVSNQIDLTTVQTTLSSILTKVTAIDVNTDTIETKLQTIITDTETNGTVNHADILAVVARLINIDANTDTLEAELYSIITNTTGLSTSALQLIANASLGNLEVNFGAKADAVATTDTGNFSFVALFKRLLQGITTLISYIGITTETAPSTDTASSGLNGRLQRIASRLTIRNGKCTNQAHTVVTATIISSTLIASNANRIKLIVENTNNQRIYLGFGITPTSTSYSVSIGQNEKHIEENWTGAINVVSASASPTVQVTELTL